MNVPNTESVPFYYTSILYRLQSHSVNQGQMYLPDIIKAIERDLTVLLNTPCLPKTCDKHLTEIADSIFNFGIADLTPFNPDNRKDQEKVAQLITQAISRFEKRLDQVYVSSVVSARSSVLSTSMHFKVNARLNVPPYKAPVSFDSRIQPSINQVVIKLDPLLGQDVDYG